MIKAIKFITALINKTHNMAKNTFPVSALAQAADIL
jgi:hypothetical protein